MPPRWLCLVIVLFWIGFNGWLFFTDLLPRILPGQPPPFTIDLAEEAQLDRRRPFIDWTVHYEGQKALRARTQVENPEHDVFVLSAEYTPLPGAKPVPVKGILLRKMTSAYRVNGSGDLLGLSVHIEGKPDFGGLLRLLATDFTADLSGDVADGKMTPRVRLEGAGGQVLERRLPEVSVALGESVLLPLHPVNRIRGLRPGQRWRMTVVDPLEGSISLAQGSTAEPRRLFARVRPQVESFSHGRRRDIPCLVIDYEGDDFRASTWVARERGQVLCQEVKPAGRDGDGTLVMYRD